MTPARIELDFAKRRPRLSVVGALVMVAGCCAAYWTYADYQDVLMQSELLQFNLARYEDNRSVAGRAEDQEGMEDIVTAARPLSTPWSALLDDLEVATRDSGKDIALLEVSPDRIKRQVRISAEARSLPAALDYVKRLQSASTLLYPMLDKHEVRSADRERPVRFEVTAEWSLPQ